MYQKKEDVTLKQRKYYLSYDGDDLAASFDGEEDSPQLKILLNICKTEGITVKDVSEFEYKRQKQLEEEKEIERIRNILND